MIKEYTDFLKFIDDALGMAKSIPRYFSKFSNKIYCNHQKLAIYVLMQKFKTTTRGIVSILRASSDMRMHLGLSRVPVHSTIVRFVNKIKKQINNLLDIRQADTVAIDATGFELESKSYYYRTVWNRDKKQKAKRYMKLNVVVDVKSQRIMTYRLHKSYRHESQSFIPLIKDLKIKYVLADRGYSGKKIRNFVIKKLKAIPVIPRKKNEGKHLVTRNKALEFEEERYLKRSIAENVFFCIKQKYGPVLRNRSCATQKTEAISKLIAHNVDRMQHLSLLILRWLHQRL